MRDAISAALKLSEAEHAHLLDLAKPKQQKRRATPQRQQVRPALREMLAAMDGMPAYVWGRRTDVLAWNRTASALLGDWDARATQDRNWARITFLDPESCNLFADWDTKASDVVGQLRLDARQHTNDPLLAELIGELSMKSEDFRTKWATHNVKRKTHDTRLSHAEPASPSAEALRLLASWGADAASATRS